MGIIMVIIQNLGNSRTYSLGFVTTRVTSTTMVFMVKILFILFWTWVLNLICKDGHSGIAWLLVLFPFILLFVIMALVMISPVREGWAVAKTQWNSTQSPDVYAGVNAQNNESDKNLRPYMQNVSNDQNKLAQYQYDSNMTNQMYNNNPMYINTQGEPAGYGVGFSLITFKNNNDTQANGQPFTREFDNTDYGNEPIGMTTAAENTAYYNDLTGQINKSIAYEQNDIATNQANITKAKKSAVFSGVHATSKPYGTSGNNLPKI